jgi:hypothetical protein
MTSKMTGTASSSILALRSWSGVQGRTPTHSEKSSDAVPLETER